MHKTRLSSHVHSEDTGGFYELYYILLNFCLFQDSNANRKRSCVNTDGSADLNLGPFFHRIALFSHIFSQIVIESFVFRYVQALSCNQKIFFKISINLYI